METVYYWIDDLIGNYPDLPLEILKEEYEDVLGAIKNEEIWNLDEEEDNIECYNAYAEWLKERAEELYGEHL